jgi:hypothetical protein
MSAILSDAQNWLMHITKIQQIPDIYAAELFCLLLHSVYCAEN